ncbi:hypothetical protein ACQCSU_07670 [Pseudarthrobacter sp. O4]|uniref:hypothetical protein n=1 Tax=Pseudarthrobacter sp. O4 TaxID=3418417 RepID=UPI003CF66779
MFGNQSRWFTPLVATAALLLAAAPAGAAVSRPPELQNFTFTTTEGCGFPVTVTGTGGKITKVELRNGSIFTVGKGVLLTYTNVGTKKSYTVNTAGSVARYVPNPDGTVTATFTGHNGAVFFASDVGGPAITQYTGRLVLTLDSLATFNVLAVKSTGPKVDVCAAIS